MSYADVAAFFGGAAFVGAIIFGLHLYAKRAYKGVGE